MSTPKIVTLDIETFPNLVYTWGLWKQNVGLNQIVRDWSIASICWKWLGEKATHYVDCEADPLNDEDLLAQTWALLDNADIVVGQNVNHFDLRKLNARFIERGFEPPSPYKTIDTLVEAKKVAMFTSNRLEWLSKHLTNAPKDSHNAFPGFELWKECMAGNPKAWAAMRKYNPRDVVATEKVYLKLRPWMKRHPNVAVLTDSNEHQCPSCGSHDLHRRGYYTTNTGVYSRFRCKSCGTWSRTRYTENTLAKRKALLTNA